MAKNRQERDYEVGYGKPPKDTQFEKGRSGNPKGRPKGSRNRGSIIRNIMGREVAVRENGKDRKITVFEALAEKMVAKALNGSMNDQVKLIQVLEKHAPDMLADTPEEIDRRITVEFVRSDGNGRPAERWRWEDWQWESHRREVAERNKDPKVVAAWKAAGFDDDEDGGGDDQASVS